MLAHHEPTVSMIVPCWRDAHLVVPLVRRFQHCTEVIVSTADQASALRQCNGANVILCDHPDRGTQMNLGAKLATGDVLLFQHADTQLTAAHLDALKRAMHDPAIVGGAFHRAFDERHPGLRWLEPLERLHCRWFGTLYGDQSLFVRRSHFIEMGGFASVPLMEDVEFSRRLRRSGRVLILDPPIASSPRNHLEHGPWRITARNALFLCLFHLGVPPHTLHRWYYKNKHTSEFA